MESRDRFEGFPDLPTYQQAHCPDLVAENDRLRALNRELVKAMEILLPLAQTFEK